MNYRMTFHTIGLVIRYAALALIAPIFIELVNLGGRPLSCILPYVYAMLILIVPSVFLTFKQPEDKTIRANEGIIVVGVSWIVMALAGALPFIFSGTLGFVDAVFESTSGFTTTGASVIANVETLSKGLQFWRCLMHFMGGMGVLMFMLAVMPNVSAGFMHVMKFESTGTQPGKLVARVRYTARILYLIYTLIMVVEFLVLLIGGVGAFDSICIALSTAGTGGFANLNASIAGYNSLFVEIVVMLFMFLFGVNFTMYFLIFVKRFKEVLKSEELRYYIIILLVAIITIALLLINTYGNFFTALRYSSFQILAFSSTTGFLTADVSAWPTMAQVILVFIMCMGACAGSTGGGFKVSRMLLLGKGALATTGNIRSNRSVRMIKMDGKAVPNALMINVYGYFVVYVIIAIIGTLIISLDGFDFTSNFTVTLSCLNNVGPALGQFSSGNLLAYGWFSKIVLSIIMLIGRLEIFPILLLFSPRTWRNR